MNGFADHRLTARPLIILLGRLIFGNFGPGHHKNDDPHKYFFRSRCRPDKFPIENNFKKWHYYDDFWEEEGEKYFDNYIERKKAEKETKYIVCFGIYLELT